MLLNPYLLSSEKSKRLSTFNRLVQASISESLSPLLVTEKFIHITKASLINCSDTEMLLEIWSYIASSLLDTIEKTQEVNQGDKRDHDFSCMYDILLWPFESSFLVPAAQVATSSAFKLWKNLFKAFIRCSSLVDTTLPNEACEIFCVRLKNMLKPELLQEAEFYESVCSYMQEVIQCVDYASSGILNAHGLSDTLLMAKQKKPLGNLTSLVDVLVLLLEIFYSQYVLPDEEQKQVLLPRRGPASKLKGPLGLVKDFINNIKSASIIRFTIEKLAEPLSMFFSVADKKKTFVDKQLEMLWDVLTSTIERHYLGPYDSDFLATLSPILELNLCHSKRHIKEKSRKFWFATFGPVTSLQYPEALKISLNKAKLRLLPDHSLDSVNEFSVANFSSRTQESDPISNTPSAKIHFAIPASVNDVKSPAKNSTTGMQNMKPTFGGSVNSAAKTTTNTQKPAPRKANIEDLPDEIFVKIDPPVACRQSARQRNFRKRKSYIPALYSELSQDMSQDTNTISSSAESHDACSSVEFPDSDPHLEYAKCTSKEKTIFTGDNVENGEDNLEPDIKKKIIEVSSNENELNMISSDVIIINDTPNEDQEIKYSTNDLTNHAGSSEKNTIALSDFELKSSSEKRKRKIEPDEVPACSSAKYRLSSRSCSDNFNQADIEVIGISDSEEIIPSSQNSSENESYMKLSVGDAAHKILLSVEKSSEKTSELSKDPAAPEEIINNIDELLNCKISDENKPKTECFEVLNDGNSKESVSSIPGLAFVNENKLNSSVKKSLETSTNKIEAHVKKEVSESNSSVKKIVSEKNVNDERIVYKTRSMSKDQKSGSSIKNSRRLSKSNNKKLGKEYTETSAGTCTNLKSRRKSSSRNEDTASNPSVHCKLDAPLENTVKQISSEKFKVDEFPDKKNEPTSLEGVTANDVQTVTNKRDVCGEETNEKIIKNTEIGGTDDLPILSRKVEEINDNQDETGNLILNSKCIEPNLMLTTKNAAVNHFVPKEEHSHGTDENDENIVEILDTKPEEHIPSLTVKKKCERKKTKSKKKALSEKETFDGKLVNSVADNAPLTMEKITADDVSISDNINELIEIHQCEDKQNEIVEIEPEYNDNSNIVLSVEETEIDETPMLDNDIEDTCREDVSSIPKISSEKLCGKEVSVSKEVEFDETPMLESDAEEAENPNNDGQDMSFMKLTEIGSIENRTSLAMEKCEKEDSRMLDNNIEEPMNLQSITKNTISNCQLEDGSHGMTSCIKAAENIKILAINGSIEKGILNTKVAREHKTLEAESEGHDKASGLTSFITENKSCGIEDNSYSFQVSEVAVENKENICNKSSEDPVEPNSIVSVGCHSVAILCNKNDKNIPYSANLVQQPDVESVCQLESNTASKNPLIDEAAPMHNVHEFLISSLKKGIVEDGIQSSEITKASAIQSEKGNLSDATNSDLEEASELCISDSVPKKEDDNTDFVSTLPDLAPKGNSGDNFSNLECDSIDIDKVTSKGCVVEKLPKKSVHNDDKNKLDIMPSNNEHLIEKFKEIFTIQTETCNRRNSIGSLLKSTEFERNFNEINEGVQDFSADKKCEDIVSVLNVEDFQIRNTEGDRKDYESQKEKIEIEAAEASNMKLRSVKPGELHTNFESGQLYLEKENSEEFNNFLQMPVGNMSSQEKIDSVINEAVSSASEVILPEIRMLLNNVLQEVDGLTHNSINEMPRLFSENSSSIPSESQVNHLQQFQVNKKQVQIVVAGLCNEVSKEVEGSKKRKKKVPVRATVAHKVKTFAPLITKKNFKLKVNEIKTLKNMQPSEITSILKGAYCLTPGNQTESKSKKTVLSIKGLSPLTQFVTTSDSHEKEAFLASHDRSPKTTALTLLHVKNKMGSDQMKTLNTYFNTSLSPQTRSFKMITASRKKLYKASEENNLQTSSAAVITSESPVNVVTSKKKRVTFADPLVEEKFLDDVSVENYAKKSRKMPARGCPKKLQSCFATPKNECVQVNRRASLTTSFPVEKDDIPSSSEFQDSDSLTEFSNLPVCSVLINCEDSVSNILHYLTSPTWVRGLESLLLSKNIKTIGDLCRLNVHEVKALPFKSPKVISLHKALIAYLTQVQTMTIQKFQRFEDGCPEQEEMDCLSNSTNGRLDDNEIPSEQQIKGKISKNEEEILNQMVETLLQNGKIEKLPSHLLSALSRKCVSVLTEKIEKSCI
ncbi:telomere-associated protein RIF1-like isoform X2 [Stegodyphus dumicola]|uniref:telomere-associated protein RIF1-like isoform X2 n=1 Tax=Stegodyphus dumicola TaxID=202533 RepID=UPI0015AAECB1|nr:telomere-associated protein RIF1-like isoform X2 [Stegodyphus dumicola]